MGTLRLRSGQAGAIAERPAILSLFFKRRVLVIIAGAERWLHLPSLPRFCAAQVHDLRTEKPTHISCSVCNCRHSSFLGVICVRALSRRDAVTDANGQVILNSGSNLFGLSQGRKLLPKCFTPFTPLTTPQPGAPPDGSLGGGPEGPGGGAGHMFNTNVEWFYYLRTGMTRPSGRATMRSEHPREPQLRQIRLPANTTTADFEASAPSLKRARLSCR